jgi:hypothetical protein
MTTDVQDAQARYNYLKPAAIRTARDYVMHRTPHHLQDEMANIIDADIPVTDPPSVIDAPFISQTGTGAGSTLNCTLGNWNGAPTSRTYQWKKDGVNIGTNAASYSVLAGDVTHIFTCTMTATNSIGTSGPTTSNQLVVK